LVLRKIMRALLGAQVRLQHMLVADAFGIARRGRLDVDAVQHLVKQQPVDAAPHAAQLERRSVPQLLDTPTKPALGQLDRAVTTIMARPSCQQRTIRHSR
jgi:hypothetical protein